jgi:hypothetical protein
MMRKVAMTTLITALGILVFLFAGGMKLKDAVKGGVKKGVGGAVERAVSERIEQALYKKLAPKEKLPPPKSPNWGQFMALQAQVIFAYAFSAGGYWMGQVAYQPGEMTKFEWKSKDNETVELERAYLKKPEDGKEWWRASWVEQDGSWIYEALISTTDGTLLRLRAKDANGNTGEVPVSGDTVIYMAPQELTEESIAGATVGREKVSTPAGSFDADHVVYMAVSGEGQVEWWITDNVPGGVVKYLGNDKEEGVVWTSTLKEMGRNATSILGSY